MNKYELTQEANNLLESNPQKSLELYTEAWKKWGNDFNEWDAFYLVKAMKESSNYDRPLMQKIYRAFHKSQLVTSQMQWMYYEREIKNCSVKELRQKEETVEKILKIGSQKDFTNSDDKFACPYTKVILKIVEAFEQQEAYGKVLFWLDKLDPTKLSRNPKTFKDNEYPSPFEKYYSKCTKALIKNEQYERCHEVCQTALESINNFHNDSDLWIRWRFAQCKHKLGSPKKTLEILSDLINNPATDTWYVKAEIASCHLSLDNLEEALKVGATAALQNKSFRFKTGLFETLAYAYAGVGRQEIGKYHALLVKSIRDKEEWPTKAEQQKLYDKFEIFDSEVIEYKKILNICKNHWQEEQFSGQEKQTGKIKVIHANGKSGHVIDESGNAYFFPIHEIQSNKPSKKQYEGSNVEFYLKEATDPDGNPDQHATNINITSWKEGENKFEELEEGSTYSGIVQNIAPFGIFVTISEYDIDGLTHKSTLKETDSLELLDTLASGDKVEVKIREITTKGPDLEILKVV